MLKHVAATWHPKFLKVENEIKFREEDIHNLANRLVQNRDFFLGQLNLCGKTIMIKANKQNYTLKKHLLIKTRRIN